MSKPRISVIGIDPGGNYGFRQTADGMALDTEMLAACIHPVHTSAYWPSDRTTSGVSAYIAASLRLLGAYSASRISGLSAALADISPDLDLVQWICAARPEDRQPVPPATVVTIIDGRQFNAHRAFLCELMERRDNDTVVRWGLHSRVVPLYPFGGRYWAMGLLALYAERQQFHRYREQKRQVFATVLSGTQGHLQKGATEGTCLAIC